MWHSELEDGATAVEYAIMVVAIAAVIVAVVVVLGSRACQNFDNTAASIAARQAGATGDSCA